MMKSICLTLFGLMLAVAPASALTIVELWEWLNDIVFNGGDVFWR